ncbi:EF-hand domain-containing protein [Chondromyces crocatus]|uniref:EF-hand domain-containing protein n=1 Tax=Chondromyces crocatus TaxID=52 RepID=A0A0K1EBH2_CHOCO|nr:EF-hand domain-containing protein [Chondromyces crocatus]AKT38210.1 uncharacterized protein CMC5_023530 [Chondromyces crocatus]
MSLNVQEQKFEYVFKWFDQNADGFLSQDDFEKIAGIFNTVADEKDEKNRATMKRGFLLWWELLQNAKGNPPAEKVSKDEFFDVMKTCVIAPENFENVVGTIVDGLIGALDRDGNGSLSLDEYVGMYDALGIPPATTTEAFKKLDRDGNGELSYAEFRQAVFEYYLSGDPDAPGNGMLGPLKLGE